MARSRACAPALLLLLAFAALGTVPRLAEATRACVEGTPGWKYSKVLWLFTSTRYSCPGGGTQRLRRSIELTKNANKTLTYSGLVDLPPPGGDCSVDGPVVEFSGNIPIPSGFSFNITPGGKRVSVLGTLSNLCVPNAAGTNPCASKASFIFTQASTAYCLPHQLFTGSFLKDYFTYYTLQNATSCAFENEVATDFTAFIKLGSTTYRLSDRPLFECYADFSTAPAGRRLVESALGSAASSADDVRALLLPGTAATAASAHGRRQRLPSRLLADRFRGRRLAGDDSVVDARAALQGRGEAAGSVVGRHAARRQLRAAPVPVTTIRKEVVLVLTTPLPPEDQIKECVTRSLSLIINFVNFEGDAKWLVDFREGYLKPNDTCFRDPTSTNVAIPYVPVANVTGNITFTPPSKLGEPLKINGTLSSKEGCTDFSQDAVCNTPLSVTFNNVKAVCADGKLYKSRDYSSREDRYTRVWSGIHCEETAGQAKVKVGSKTFTITGPIRFDKDADVINDYK